MKTSNTVPSIAPARLTIKTRVKAGAIAIPSIMKSPPPIRY